MPLHHDFYIARAHNGGDQAAILTQKLTQKLVGGGFELSNRPWRDAPLDDVQALALTPVVNKQLLRYLGRGKGTAP